MEKSRGGCRSKYLISQHSLFTRLCLMILYINIIFLFNKIIIKINIHIKLIEYNQSEMYLLCLLEILLKNKYYSFLKINFNYIEHKKS